MYFAGFSGQLIIKINKDNQWTILKINYEAEEPSIIGFIKKKTEYPRPDLTSIIGFNTVNCYIPEKNETVSELFKLTNVSNKEYQVFCLKYMLLVELPGLAHVHPPAQPFKYIRGLVVKIMTKNTAIVSQLCFGHPLL